MAKAKCLYITLLTISDEHRLIWIYQKFAAFSPGSVIRSDPIGFPSRSLTHWMNYRLRITIIILNCSKHLIPASPSSRPCPLKHQGDAGGNALPDPPKQPDVLSST